MLCSFKLLFDDWGLGDASLDLIARHSVSSRVELERWIVQKSF